MMRSIVFTLLILVFCTGIGIAGQFYVQHTVHEGKDLKKEKIQLDIRTFKSLSGRNNNTFDFSLPIYGDVVQFTAVKNDVFVNDSGIQDEIYTYDVFKSDDKAIYGALTIGSSMVYVHLFNFGRMISVYPDLTTNEGGYWVEYGIQPEFKSLQQYCSQDNSIEEMIHHNTKAGSKRVKLSLGSNYYSYKVAIVATGEYYINNGNSDNTVRVSIVNSVNAISAIFKNEASISLKTSSSIIKMYSDPATDPFSPGTDRTLQARQVVSDNFTSNRYDIGHVFHQHRDGDGWENGGVALLSSVCNNSGNPPAKGGGWSGSYSNVGNGWINLATHEFGHQFSATHTFNGIGSSCTDNISTTTAVEIGSGTTIMSYNGVCGLGQNIPNSGELDNYFHVVSLEQIYNFVYNGSGGSCGNPDPSSNLLPEVTANPCNATYIIPKNTPFYIEAEGSFDDEDGHTYCWEQTDEDGAGKPTQGKAGLIAAIDPKAPIFRSYPPTDVPYRYFPNLTSVVQGKVNTFDVLSLVPRTIHLSVTVRDNNKDGGAVASDDVVITVDNSGPLEMIRPVGGETLVAGNMETISWNTNGSNSLCSKVRVRLSYDSGKSFDYILAENIDYSAGRVDVDLPMSMPGSENVRVMVECMDYSCFKIYTVSKTNFTIQSDCKAPLTEISPIDPKTFEESDQGLKLNLKNNLGNTVTKLSGILRSDDVSGNLIFLDNVPAQCAGPSNAVKYDVHFFTVDISGSYTFDHGGKFGTVMNVYENIFTGTNCINHIGSNATRPSGTGSIDLNQTLSLNLVAGVQYFMIVSSFSESLPILPSNYSVTLTNKPAGANLYSGIQLPIGYNYTYIAISNVDGVIAGHNEDSDFTTLRAGSYCVYGAAYRNDQNPDTWIGKTLNEIIVQGACILTSAQCKPLTITPACFFSDVVVGTQTACVIGPNTYTQELTISYERAPTTGKINVNGQEFDVTTSPQTIVLQGLDSDGQPVDVTIFFSEVPECRTTRNNLFTAPANCCPIVLDLGEDVDKCDGASVLLFAGDNGTEYIWQKDGVVIAGNNSKTYPVNASGVYSVEVTHASGCKKTDTVAITFRPLPQIVFPAVVEFCAGDVLDLRPMITNGARYEWYMNGQLIDGQTEDNIQITEGGVYKIVVYSDYDCKNEASVIVRQIPLPVVELGADQRKCDGEIALLDAGPDGVSYVWYLNNIEISRGNESTYEAKQSGIYKVVVTNSTGCSTEDFVKVDFFASPSIEALPPFIDFCEGVGGSITAQAKDYKTLKWYIDQVHQPTFDNNPTIIVAKAGLYTVEVTNLANCTVSRTVEAVFRPLPTIELGDDLTLCIGNPLVLDGGIEGVKFEWTKDGNPLPNTERKLTVIENGTYAVTVTSEYGCMNQDEVKVNFIPGPSVTLNGDATFCEGESHSIIMTTDATDPVITWLDQFGNILPENGNVLIVTEPGTYKVSVIGGTPACEVIKEVNITTNPKPKINLGNDRILCDGDTAPVLNAGPGNVSYSWTLNGNPLASTQNVTATQSGVYEVKVKNQFGCENTEKVSITYEPIPSIDNLQSDYALCEGSTALVIDLESDGSIFEWKLNNNTIQGQTADIINITEPGSYEVIVSTPSGCKNSATFTVTQRPKPSVDLGDDFNLCPGDSRILDAGVHDQYVWSDSSTGATLEVTADEFDEITHQLYTVIVTNEYGCSDTDSIEVSIYPVIKAAISSDQPGVCNGAPVKLTASGGIVYEWNDPEGNTLSSLNTAETIATPSKTTTYSVVVSDGICPDNKDEKSIQIIVFEPVNVSAGNDTCVLAGRPFRLNAKGGVSYQWDHPELIISGADSAHPEVQITQEVTFTVTITDINGCTYTDQISICVKEDSFQAVTIITPNGDGKNDVLYFNDLENYPDNQLRIFNRWGNLIFEAEGYQQNDKLFDGIRNGERLPADTYYYILTFDGQTYKSALTILWD